MLLAMREDRFAHLIDRPKRRKQIFGTSLASHGKFIRISGCEGCDRWVA